jgi:hypothetical protein
VLGNIRKTYHYVDHSGEHYFLLTEEIKNEEKNTKIKAINVVVVNGKAVLDYEINDSSVHGGETGIWFWSRYSKFEDVTHEGVITPVIVYGTK